MRGPARTPRCHRPHRCARGTAHHPQAGRPYRSGSSAVGLRWRRHAAFWSAPPPWCGCVSRRPSHVRVTPRALGLRPRPDAAGPAGAGRRTWDAHRRASAACSPGHSRPRRRAGDLWSGERSSTGKRDARTPRAPARTKPATCRLLGIWADGVCSPFTPLFHLPRKAVVERQIGHQRLAPASCRRAKREVVSHRLPHQVWGRVTRSGRSTVRRAKLNSLERTWGSGPFRPNASVRPIWPTGVCTRLRDGPVMPNR